MGYFNEQNIINNEYLDREDNYSELGSKDQKRELLERKKRILKFSKERKANRKNIIEPDIEENEEYKL